MTDRSRTEDWVFSGLSIPSKVVLAKRSSPERLPPGGYVHIAGNEHALGVAQFLGQLALSRRALLRCEWQRGQLFEHWFRADRIEKLAANRCGLLLLLMGSKVARADHLAAKVREMLDRAGDMKIQWILPFEEEAEDARLLRLVLPSLNVETLASHLVPVHRAETGAPSARGYAGWAGAVWSRIR